MSQLSIQRLAILSTLALVVSPMLNSPIRGQPPDTRTDVESPKSIVFSSDVGWKTRHHPEQDHPFVAPSVHVYHLDDVTTSGGQKVAPYLVLDRTIPIAGTDGSRSMASVTQWYRDLKIGQIVPMLGAIYRVSDVSAPPNTLKMDRLSDSDLLKTVPVSPDSITVAVGNGFDLTPLGSGGEGSGGGVTISKFTIPKNKYALLTATASISTSVIVAPRNSWIRKREQDLIVGDVVPFAGNYELVVRKIVPPDDEPHVVGWVEFRPRIVIENGR